MRKLLIAISLCASVAYGQWTNSVWPAWDVQRAGKVQAENVYEALRERDWASQNAATIDALAWYRSQRTMLVAWKTDLKAIANQAVWVSTNTTIAGATNIPTITLAQIYNECSLPTNYFDYTPWRCLNGNGPFATDTNVVGRGHGWTNATTAAGGTNFSGTRATWYTTDYGWQGMYDILNKLVLTKHTDEFSDDTEQWITRTEVESLTCSTAYTGHTNNWVTDPDNGGWTGFGNPYWYAIVAGGSTNASGGGEYNFYGYIIHGPPYLTSIDTNTPCAASIYLIARADSGLDFNDIDGLGYTQNVYSLYETLASTNTATRTGTLLGTTNAPPSDPVIDAGIDCSNTDTNASLVVLISETAWIMDWDFDYKE